MTWLGEENSFCACSFYRDFIFLGLRGGLTLLQFAHRFLQHFRMREQIVVHYALDVGALRGREDRARTACGAATASNAAKAAAIMRRLDVIGFVLAVVI